MDALIKSTEILTNVKQLLRLSSTKHDIWINSLIEQGSRDLNSPETLIIKNCEVTVTNNKFYMPKEAKTLLAFRCKNSCIEGTFVDFNFLQACGCTGTGLNQFNNIRNVADINGRWVNFLSRVPDGDIVEIAYREVWTDEDGDIVINEEAYTHLSMYAAYWFAVSYPENYTPEQRRAWGAFASVQGNRVRSAAARRKFEQQKAQITNLMFTVVRGGSFGNLSGSFPFWYNTYNYIN